jgi:hypothetical protein
MKKIVRLTESDLVRIVKRVMNEQLGSPLSAFNSKMEDYGFISIMGDKNQNILPENYDWEDVSFIYIGKPGGKYWKYTKVYDWRLNGLEDIKNPAWKPVKNPKIVDDLNKVAPTYVNPTY